MKSFVCFITHIAVALAAQGIYMGTKPVIYSEEAQDGEFPYQARITACGVKHCISICGGTIINPTAVLTAGSCCWPTLIYMVGVGMTKPSEGITERNIILAAGFTKHRGFKESARPYNDICIMHLVKSIENSTNIQPAALPSSGATPTGTAVLSGFGTSIFPYNPSKELRKVTLKIISMDECGNEFTLYTTRGFPAEFKENSSIICTSGKSLVLPCVFDKGGPLSQNGVVIGVVSFAFSYCNIPNSVPLYTAVGHYIDWINRHATPTDLQGANGVDTGDSIEKGEVGMFDEFYKILTNIFNEKMLLIK